MKFTFSGPDYTAHFSLVKEELDSLKTKIDLLQQQIDYLTESSKLDSEEVKKEELIHLESEFDIENNNVISLEFIEEYGEKKALFTVIVNYQYQEINLPCNEDTYNYFLNRFRTKLKLRRNMVNPIQDLMDKQEPLGEDFGKVLHENLWDLYSD